MPKTKRLQVGLTEAAYEWVRKEAEAVGMTMSEFVRHMVMDKYIGAQKKGEVSTSNG